MSDSSRRIHLEGVDWAAVAPVLRLAGAFRMALQPGKLALALLAVLLLFGSGWLVDLAWGDVVESGVGGDRGVFETVLDRQGAGLHALMESAWSLELGLDSVGAGAAQWPARPTGVVGAARFLAVDTPCWLLQEHFWPAALLGLIKLLVIGLLGGAICRMAATQACVGRTVSAAEGLRFAWQRGAWFVGAPLMPGLLIGVLGGVLALAGLVFFNAPVADVVGSVLWGVLLLVGLLVTLVGLGLVLGAPLMYPCLAVEGTDGFDVVSRCYHYVFFRPWHYVVYMLAAVFLAVVSYRVVGVVVSAALYATDYLVGIGSFVVVDDATRYDAAAGEETLGAASWVMSRWIGLVHALVAAFMLSLFFCLMTHVYLLLRRAADGTPLDDCDTGGGDVLWATAADDASASAPAAGG